MIQAHAPFWPADLEGMESLVELAFDLRVLWKHSTDEIWGQLEPELWSLTHNPWLVMQTASRTKLAMLWADPPFRQKVDALARARREALQGPTWFQRTHGDSPLTGVAYFSMEFGLSEALPIYSGGLGNVAGDQLKAASDLGVPVVGVGILYQAGYFRQVIVADGAQLALYPHNNPGQLPITPVRGPDGEWLRLRITFPGHAAWIRVWQAHVGRLHLYLLDSNDPANDPTLRGITSELYGGGSEMRLAQELVLGIGGWRLIRSLGLTPEVCHLNEGHAAFAVLERAAAFMEDSGQPFDVALAATRAGNLFTTHTPVAAGFDRFAPALVEGNLSRYATTRLGISMHDLLALGRQNPDDSNEPFNMAYLAIRGSGGINAVSQLHGRVSRRIFQGLFPRWPEPEVPVGHVTNGIHVPSWDSAAAEALWTKASGENCWGGMGNRAGEGIRRLSDAELWQLRRMARHDLLRFARKRLARQLAAAGAPEAAVEEAMHVFDPDALTLGFARRFATYKRPNMLLHDRSRLLRLLSHPERPVQLIIAGKAHPADQAGQEMIKAWIQFIRQPAARPHVIFLSDYDLLLAEHLVQGVDVWINTPRRPWEASGTSGMKVLVNGGINLSELDGWWAEAYAPEVGWPLGDGQEHGDDPAWDAVEAEALYALLEEKVIPAFYARDTHEIPTAWVAIMRESMARLTPRFSADRAVREYTEKHYLAAAAAYRWRSVDRGAHGARIVAWQGTLARTWADVRFADVQVETRGAEHIFTVKIYLGELAPDAVRVELFADSAAGATPQRHEMTESGAALGTAGGYIFSGRVRADRPASDYTPRVIPHHQGAMVPLEADRILWQK
ncbi:MAG: alpha-glucan family phosphorylase [Candidatus Rokuibacteriota bacterium]